LRWTYKDIEITYELYMIWWWVSIRYFSFFKYLWRWNDPDRTVAWRCWYSLVMDTFWVEDKYRRTYTNQCLTAFMACFRYLWLGIWWRVHGFYVEKKEVILMQ